MVKRDDKPEDAVHLVSQGTSSLLLQGDDDLTIAAVHESLCRLIPESSRIFNIEQAGGAELDASRLADSLRSVPMMSPYRMLTIREPDRLTPEAVKVLLDYLDSPRPETILVIVAEKKGKSTASWKRLTRKLSGLRFNRPPPWELQKWVERYLERYRLGIDRRAAGELIDAVGNELRDLANELDKLAVVREAGETISSADVDRIVGHGRFADIQQLRKSLMAADRAGAVRLVDDLLYQGEPPIKLVSLLSRFFADLWRIKAVRSEARDYKAAAEMLGLWPSLVREYWNAAERIEAGGLARAQEICYDVDFKVKTGRGNPRILLQQAVLRLSGLIRGDRPTAVGPAAGRPA